MNGGGFGGAATQAEHKYGPPPNKKEVRPSYIPPKPYMKTIEHNPSPDFIASDTSALQVGQKVEHQKFGFGEVTKLEGSAHNPVATVRFQYNGEKKIMLNYAKLRIVE
jgi:DNA helicase-2/ATP-dependent DNA helicase PcrA